MPTWLTGLFVLTWMAVGYRTPAEEPQVAGAYQIEGRVETDRNAGHGCSLGTCAGGRYWVWRHSSGWPPAGWLSPGRSGGAAPTPRRRSGPGCTPASPR